MIPCFAKRDGAFELNALSAVLKSQKDILQRAEHMLEEMNMADKRHMHAAAMSRGDKRRLEIGMCLSQEPRLLLLDEPTAGMARADTNNTIDLLEADLATSATSPSPSSNMTCMWCSALPTGSPFWPRAPRWWRTIPQNIRGNPKVREAYLGETRVKEE